MQIISAFKKVTVLNVLYFTITNLQKRMNMSYKIHWISHSLLPILLESALIKTLWDFIFSYFHIFIKSQSTKLLQIATYFFLICNNNGIRKLSVIKESIFSIKLTFCSLWKWFKYYSYMTSCMDHYKNNIQTLTYRRHG